MKYAFYIFILLATCFQACHSGEVTPDPFEHISDDRVVSLLQASFASMGALEKWRDIQTLRFNKYFVLYRESGATESEARQLHRYQFHPVPEVEISWKTDNEDHQITYSHHQPLKKVNGQVDTAANSQSLLNNVLSSTFVISIPYKLLDRGVDLTYAGTDTLEDDQAVEVIRASYDPGQHDHHSTPDVWWYFFDAKDQRLMAYMVKHADHYSYVKNLSFVRVDGFLFPEVRKSYRVDKDRNILYLRADYEYSAYRVER